MDDEFFVDKHGGEENNSNQNEDIIWDESDGPDDFIEEEEDFFDELPYVKELEENKAEQNKHKTFSLDDTYLITKYTKRDEVPESTSNVNKMLKKSSIQAGLEKQHQIETQKTQRGVKLERKKIRDSTKGKKWFDMPATEVTDEIKNDMQILRMRSVLDTKHHYKNNVIKGQMKYFQIGTVVEGPADFYNGRIVKSQRKKTLVDELLADAEFKSYQKKKFKEIMDSHRWKGKDKKNTKKGKDSKDIRKQSKKGKNRKNNEEMKRKKFGGHKKEKRF